jgi:hypothetical protein
MVTTDKRSVALASHHQGAKTPLNRVAKQRHIPPGPAPWLPEFILQQAAQHHTKAVFHQHGGPDSLLVGATGGVDGGGLHIDPPGKSPVSPKKPFSLIWFDLERQPHVFALNG